MSGDSAGSSAITVALTLEVEGAAPTACEKALATRLEDRLRLVRGSGEELLLFVAGAAFAADKDWLRERARVSGGTARFGVGTTGEGVGG